MKGKGGIKDSTLIILVFVTFVLSLSFVYAQSAFEDIDPFTQGIAILVGAVLVFIIFLLLFIIFRKFFIGA